MYKFNTDASLDIGPVLLADHFHEDYLSLVEQVMSTDESVPVSTCGTATLQLSNDIISPHLP